jgi:hypothetical protein
MELNLKVKLFKKNDRYISVTFESCKVNLTVVNSSLGLEPTRKEKSWEAKADVEKIRRERREDMDSAEESGPIHVQSSLAGCCCSPMLHPESTGLNQVSQSES